MDFDEQLPEVAAFEHAQESLGSIGQPVLSRIRMDLSRGSVVVETEQPTEADSSFHRALR